MDVSDFDPDSLNHDKRVSTKRKVETQAHPRTQKPKLSWKRRKEDLHLLRAEVVTLLTHKENLEMQRDFGSSQRDEEVLNRWRDDANLEKQRCQQANEENTRLKRTLQRCLQAYDGLKRLADASQTKQSINATLQNQRQFECRHSPTVFNLLENRLNKRLLDLRYVYIASNASAARTDFDQAQVYRGGGAKGASALEFNRMRLLPFTTNVTSDTVWDVMKLGVIADERGARAYIRSEDLLASQGCFTHELHDGGSVDIRVCCLVKRVETPEGFMALIESITEWVATPSSSKEWRHVTRDSGWVAVRPVATKSAASRLCQLQLALRLQTNESAKVKPTHCNHDSLLLARTVSDVMVDSMRSILNSRYQLVDNALLDATV